MKIGLFLISIFLLLNIGCGSQKKVVNQKEWVETIVSVVDQNNESKDYFVGTVSFAATWTLKHDVKNFEKILSVLKYSLKSQKNIKIAVRTGQNGAFIIDVRKIEDDN